MGLSIGNEPEDRGEASGGDMSGTFLPARLENALGGAREFSAELEDRIAGAARREPKC
jgi:hypothetical protein